MLRIDAGGVRREVMLPLPGRFQADNALMAAALAAALGERDVLDRLGSLRGVRGRLELAARLPNGAAVYVDYAHTPDALERLLTALRPHTTGRLHVVFGAGGDRDRGKRPLMGAAAARLADVAIVTDDNPRSEDPAAIRAAVLAACPGGREIGDRARAIAEALNGLGAGDVLAVAGKGHEQGQTIGDTVIPFDDVDVVRRLAVMSRTLRPSPTLPQGEGVTALPLPLREGVGEGPAACVGHMTALWTARPAEATAARWTPFAATGVSIDTRTLQPGDLFVALQGETGDGHALRRRCARQGRGRRDGASRRARCRPRCCWSTTRWPACIALAAIARAALHRPARRGDRQRRQDDDEGDAADHPVRVRPHPCRGRLLQQPLGPAADLGAHAAGHRILRRRDRHEPSPARSPRWRVSRGRMSR